MCRRQSINDIRAIEKHNDDPVSTEVDTCLSLESVKAGLWQGVVNASSPLDIELRTRSRAAPLVLLNVRVDVCAEASVLMLNFCLSILATLGAQCSDIVYRQLPTSSSVGLEEIEPFEQDHCRTLPRARSSTDCLVVLDQPSADIMKTKLMRGVASGRSPTHDTACKER